MSNNLYDAVIVLGCNITPVKDGFAPSTYADHDQYGMLAGQMNVIAATWLWRQQVSDTFLFSTGTSAKTKAAYGSDLPTEAQIYSSDFLERLEQLRHSNQELSRLDSPHLLLEERSVNTYTNLTEVLAIIKHQGWQNILLISARYHMPRLEALYKLINQTYPKAGYTTLSITFRDSEGIILDADPGTYDDEIAAAYASEWGQKRLESEANGLRDIQDGTYHIGELQLKTA